MRTDPIAGGLVITLIVTSSCTSPKANTDEQVSNGEAVSNETAASNERTSDTLDHGYNEFANPANHRTFTISDYNTDNPEIQNVQRPGQSTIKTQLDTSALFCHPEQ